MANRIKFNNSDDEISNFDPSNSDEDEREEERNLKKKLNQNRKPRETGKKQVYRFDDESDEDEDENDNDLDDNNDIVMNDSDIEDNNNDDDIPDAKAWGKKRGAYYGTSFVDPDFNTYSARDEEMAYEEEEEARAIQTRLAQELNDADFSLDVYGQQPNEDDTDEIVTITEKIKSDLNDLSKRQKLQLFHKDSPEFQGLLDDFQNGVVEADETLVPLIKYAKENHLIKMPAFQMISTKFKITLNYIINIGFYFLLKANRTEIKNHPIIKRLVQQRKLLLQLNEKYDKCMKDKMNHLLELIKSGEELKILPQTNIKCDSRIVENSEEFENEEMDEIEEDLESRRPITYQISKNKGLTPHRKKELRNPRVKHRNKFKKALVRRKGAVRTVRTEDKRYSGELFGIKATVKKGIKIKS